MSLKKVLSQFAYNYLYISDRMGAYSFDLAQGMLQHNDIITHRILLFFGELGLKGLVQGCKCFTKLFTATTKPHISIPAFDPFPILFMDVAHSLAEGMSKMPASTRSPQMRSAESLPMLGNNVVDFLVWSLVTDDVNHRNTCVTEGFFDPLNKSFQRSRWFQ